MIEITIVQERLDTLNGKIWNYFYYHYIFNVLLLLLLYMEEEEEIGYFIILHFFCYSNIDEIEDNEWEGDVEISSFFFFFFLEILWRSGILVEKIYINNL